jgi:hypothetical protein
MDAPGSVTGKKYFYKLQDVRHEYPSLIPPKLCGILHLPVYQSTARYYCHKVDTISPRRDFDMAPHDGLFGFL